MANGHADSEGEGEIFLSFLALLFDCRIRKTGFRINGLDISGNHPQKPHIMEMFEGTIDSPECDTYVTHLFTLGSELTKQFARACNAYSLAIASVELDTSLSFLLLVTALECISTQEAFCPNSTLDKSKKSTERYCRLVQNYCDEVNELYPSDAEPGFIRDLKTVYYSHRSGFVHGGKEVSVASKIADRAGLNSVGHIVDGKEIVTPGLKWFFQVTRRTLIGFLKRFPRGDEPKNPQVLADIAGSRSILTVRVGGA